MTISEVCDLLLKVYGDYQKSASSSWIRADQREWAERAATGVALARKFLLDQRDREEFSAARYDGEDNKRSLE